MKYNTCKILEFKSTREPIKVLGICLSHNQDRNIEDLWLSRDFTLCGKFFLTKTLGVPISLRSIFALCSKCSYQNCLDTNLLFPMEKQKK